MVPLLIMRSWCALAPASPCGLFCFGYFFSLTFLFFFFPGLFEVLPSSRGTQALSWLHNLPLAQATFFAGHLLVPLPTLRAVSPSAPLDLFCIPCSNRYLYFVGDSEVLLPSRDKIKNCEIVSSALDKLQTVLNFLFLL